MKGKKIEFKQAESTKELATIRKVLPRRYGRRYTVRYSQKSSLII